ncbi:MAG: hypothetical protein WDN04_05065 [Rhodospirillales bacterium]
MSTTLRAGYDAVAGWLSKVGGAVGGALLPDFSDVLDGLDLSNAVPGYISPEQLEERARQWAEQERVEEEERQKRALQAAAEKRDASRRQQIAEVQEKLEAMPGLPGETDAPYLTQDAVQQATLLASAAADAFKALDGALQAEDAVWNKDLEGAVKAIEAAVAAIVGLQREAATQRVQRQATLQQLREAAAGQQDPLSADAKGRIEEKQVRRTKLKSLQKELQGRMDALEQVAQHGDLASFAEAARGADQAIKDVAEQAKQVEALAAQKRKEATASERTAQIKDLRWTKGKLDGGELAVLADGQAEENLRAAFNAYTEPFATLEKAVGAADEAFESARLAAEKAYNLLSDAYDLARLARERELARRARVVDDYDGQRNKIAASPVPAKGTQELQDFVRAQGVAFQPIGKLRGDAAKLSPAEFSKRCEAIEAALQVLREAAKQAGTEAAARTQGLTDQQQRLDDALQKALAALPNGPRVDIVQAAEAALRHRAGEDRAALTGLNPGADRARVDEFEGGVVTAAGEIAAQLNGINVASFTAVAANEGVDGLVTKLLAQFKGPEGVGAGATQLAADLQRLVKLTKDRYDRIDALGRKYDLIIQHDDYNRVSWASEIKPCQDLVAGRDKLGWQGLDAEIKHVAAQLDKVMGWCEREARAL